MTLLKVLINQKSLKNFREKTHSEKLITSQGQRLLEKRPIFGESIFSGARLGSFDFFLYLGKSFERVACVRTKIVHWFEFRNCILNLCHEKVNQKENQREIKEKENQK